ncbi:Predicted ATP-dependent carboligase, ATP-grasp superfamily [Nocardioides scoriae]|uniref:Predicted ATP-dependent carboligase, ATP-grasp superfamily n=1 Tax=Nocardioides scoriae TaxID=642780 RepID=A0A1H1V4N8_9ACTN|nr:ATP-grasp enzyme [Nocardioides scoriae]SDS79695.1 Predicted ATP-dependent carboligase, ATP-grasp superfamily [Nocardioides scoriae]
MTVRDTARTLGAVAALGATAPLNAAVTGAALLSTVVRPGRPRARAARPLTVMVSGGKMTKALQLCRSFHAAGHRVVLVETAGYRLTGHRSSRSVAAFHTVPAPGDPTYADALEAIARAEGVDAYVPVCSPASSVADARAKKQLEQVCEVVHLDADVLERLDDKFEFARAAAALGLAVPDTHRITDPQQVLDHDFSQATRPYILKSIAYDPVHRLDLTRLPFGPPEAMEAFVRSLPISEDNPWILQEFIEGREFCTHSTVRGGRLTVYCCCASSAFQINYEMVDHPAIRAWVDRFVEGQDLTGQVSLDFIEDADGEVFAIECNPRTHSAVTMLYDHDGVADAYLSDEPGPVVVPTATSRPTYWLYHEVWRLLTLPDRRERLRTITRGTDAILQRTDPLPFFLEHHVQVPALLLRKLRSGGSWIRIDFNIGKLVEAGGD